MLAVRRAADRGAHASESRFFWRPGRRDRSPRPPIQNPRAFRAHVAPRRKKGRRASFGRFSGPKAWAARQRRRAGSGRIAATHSCSTQKAKGQFFPASIRGLACRPDRIEALCSPPPLPTAALLGGGVGGEWGERSGGEGGEVSRATLEMNAPNRPRSYGTGQPPGRRALGGGVS